MTKSNVATTEFTIATAQYDVTLGDIQANIDRSEIYIREAADADARIVVLPECASGGWAFASRDESMAFAQDLDSGPTIDAWKKLSNDLDIWICGGFGERDQSGRLFNSSVLISPGGVELLYRKVHLWNTENLAFDSGNLGFPVIKTPFGSVGMLICYDAWFPESFRSLAVHGADLVLAPSDWVPNPQQPDDMPPLAHIMAMSAAHSNQVYVVSASRIGLERGQRFIGRSSIVDYHGWILASAADDAPQITTATIDPIGSRERRKFDPFNRPMWDRRVDQYSLGLAVER